MVKVSVLMPVYNTNEEYLKEAINSILHQTFSDFELIIVDDGSKNDIENVIKTFSDNRIKFYKNNENSGVARTRNKLMSLAQGEYIAWQDSDDISYPDRLLKQVDFLDNNPDISIVGSYLECFPNKKIIALPKNPKPLDFIGGCMISQPSCMIKINDFKKYNLEYNPNLITSEDYDLFSRAVKFLNCANIETPLVKYRISQNSLYHRANQYSYKIDKEIKNSILQFLTSDKKLQKKIIQVITSQYKKKANLLENMFSIRNEWYGDVKYKIIVILGLKIKLRRHKEK